MKFNLNDFLQLDTNGLLVVNGGSGCSSGSSSGSSDSSGGTCSAGTQTPPVENPNTEKTSGKFAQITDGSYADNLTMQFYKNIGDEKSDNAMYVTHIDKNSNKEI